ncbi:MAG: hypothetical protein MIO92_11410 [Methanosarcinaceae archaeon]|nr:hypothetical protein [Methanosarcinaceae archaeon]
MDYDRTKEVLKMIADDMEKDANSLDGQPFNGKTVATQFGNQCAAIKALANVIHEIISINEINGDKNEENIYANNYP